MVKLNEMPRDMRLPYREYRSGWWTHIGDIRVQVFLTKSLDEVTLPQSALELYGVKYHDQKVGEDENCPTVSGYMACRRRLLKIEVSFVEPHKDWPMQTWPNEDSIVCHLLIDGEEDFGKALAEYSERVLQLVTQPDGS